MTLAEHLEDALAPPDRERFVIDGPKTADWALRKIAHAKARQDENTRLADAERDRIDEWEETENTKLQHDVEFFEALLVDYHHRVLDAEPDRRTIALPAGKLKARKLPDRWQFDPEAFIAWAVRSGRPEFVRQPPPEVDRAEAKKALAIAADGIVVEVATGEKAEGVVVEPGDVRFSVEVTP